jgi:spore maturation protein CgeB
MRIAIVDTYYPAFQDSVYAARPELRELPYDRQLRGVLDAFFGTADSFSHHLRALGHDAVDVVANCGPLQERWAAERGTVRLGRRLAALPGRQAAPARLAVQRRIARAQIADFDPDVVYCHNLAFFTRRDLDALRRERRLVVGQIASPLPSTRLVEGFDLVTTSFPHFVTRLRARGLDAEYFRLAFDARVHAALRARGTDPDAGSARDLDVVFVGGVDLAVHRAGTELLERICARRRVDVWGYGADRLPPGSAILRHFHGPAWGLDMYAVLARARVAINRHIDVAEGHANNMRLYEATGTGAMLVTDAGSNLGDLFEPGAEVVAYRDPDELEAALDRYLADEAARRAVAAAGQRRTLGEHTYDRRMEELVGLLEPRLRR